MAKKSKFVGSIQHTEETIQRMYQTQYYTYQTMRMLIRMGIGVVLVVSPFLFTLPMAVRAVMMMLGCWLLVSRDFPASVKADQVVESRKGALPLYVCTFFDDRVELEGEGSMKIPYKKFQRLVEDDSYLYLFLAKNSLCMIEKETVTGGTDEELKDFVAQRTGLDWMRNRSLLSLNLMDLHRAWKDRKQA